MRSKMEKRAFGNKGDQLSILGFGGIVAAKETQEDANAYVQEALEQGINYFDVAPTYDNAQERLGVALQGKRKEVFLACKTEKRTQKEAELALYDSLKTLKTDYFDLYQLHAMSTKEDLEVACGPKGALETLIKAKKDGLVRHIGFSAHSEEVALALIEEGVFDSVLFPINWVAMITKGFGVELLKKAKEKNMTILALKPMAQTIWEENETRTYQKTWYKPIEQKELASLALRFTLSQGITAAIPPGEIKLFRWAVETVKDFKPLSQEEEKLLFDKAETIKPLFPLV